MAYILMVYILIGYSYGLHAKLFPAAHALECHQQSYGLAFLLAAGLHACGVHTRVHMLA